MKPINDNDKRRGWILRVLAKVYPDPLDQDTVKKYLIDVGFLTGETDLRQDIAFLAEQELIKAERIGASVISRAVVRLTYKGKNLVDGNTPDVAGVDVG